MKECFSLSYTNRFANAGYCVEVRFPWFRLGDTVNFPNKRVNIQAFNISTRKEDFLAQLEIFFKKELPYTIEVESFNLLRELLAKGYNTFLHFPVTDWETFTALAKLGVSDIIVDSPLTFCLEELAAARRNHPNLKLRLMPTSTGNSSFMEASPHSFYVLPQHLPNYLSTFDIVSFAFDGRNAEDALYTIYSQGHYMNNVDTLIPYSDIDLPADFFADEFFKHRSNCRQICINPRYSCTYCTTYCSTVKLTKRIEELKSEHRRMEETASTEGN